MLYNPKWKSRKPKTKSPAEIYSAAADVIAERGHSIGNLEDKEGRMCVWGAIAYAVTGDAIRGSSKTWHLLPALSRFTGGIGVVGWNNREGRTKRQVVAMLRKASRTLAK